MISTHLAEQRDRGRVLRKNTPRSAHGDWSPRPDRPDPVDLIVVDSGSKDGTREAASRAGARIIEMDPSRFSHGGARDLGARAAEGDVYVFTVQDARPADAHWLRFLVEPLAAGAAAATSRILPLDEMFAVPLDAHRDDFDLRSPLQCRRRHIQSFLVWSARHR